jgi:hypothetical protein
MYHRERIQFKIRQRDAWQKAGDFEHKRSISSGSITLLIF